MRWDGLPPDVALQKKSDQIMEWTYKVEEKELRQAIEEWNQRKFSQFLLQRNIKWIFNPLYASHMGGVWERLIRSIRKVLNAILNAQALTDESLQTLWSGVSVECKTPNKSIDRSSRFECFDA